jgi:hypothetical protein
MDDAGVRRTVRTKGCRRMPDECNSRDRWRRRSSSRLSLKGVVAAAATGLLRGPLRFRPLRGPAAPPCTSLDLARSTRSRQARNASNAEKTLGVQAGQLVAQKRIRVQAYSGAASPCLLLCAGKSVPRFSQQGQTINVRAVNARALAGARVPAGRPLHCPLVRTFLNSLL